MKWISTLHKYNAWQKSNANWKQFTAHYVTWYINSMITSHSFVSNSFNWLLCDNTAKCKHYHLHKTLALNLTSCWTISMQAINCLCSVSIHTLMSITTQHASINTTTFSNRLHSSKNRDFPMQGNTFNIIIKYEKKFNEWKNLQFHNILISTQEKVIQNKTNIEFGSVGSHQEMP